jgi:thiamine biosynthesis protein ThiI
LPGKARQVDDTLIVRPGPDEAVKSGQTRRVWRARLRANIADALNRRGIDHEVREGFGRLFVVTSQRDAALGVLPYVFGIANISPVLAMAPSDTDAIAAIGGDVFRERVRGRRFAVRCRRQSCNRLTSPEVERALGAALTDAATVDLDDPEVTVRVEVLGGRALISDARVPGAGGMPAGLQGRALVLVSGGYDSAVAAWRVMRRGAATDFVLCNLGGTAYERQVLQVVKLLTEAWGFGLGPRLHVVDFAETVRQIREHVRSDHWQLVLKRVMYRAARRVARETGAECLVTGEMLGQVSSQTLTNLAAIDTGETPPVLRPLAGMDKDEIMAEATRIGTAPLSERVRELCHLDARPVVKTTRARLDRQTARLDLDALDAAVDDRRVIDLNAVGAAEMREPYLFTDTIPADARVIDCQPPHMYNAWHAPGAEHWDADRLAQLYKRLPRDETYVLYCTFGTQTPVLAELMQQAGFDAYAFRGGLSRVQQHVERRDRAAAE